MLASIKVIIKLLQGMCFKSDKIIGAQFMKEEIYNSLKNEY